MKFSKMIQFSALILLLLQSGCGGGGNETVVVPENSTNQSSSTNSGQIPSNCPSTSLADAWLDKRISCLAVGQSIIDLSASASGDPTSYSFVIEQKTYDSGFNNVLGFEKGRFFSRIVCVKNAPSGLINSNNRLSLATDLVVAVRNSGTFPKGYSIFMSNNGGNQLGAVEEACNDSKHPIVINFTTKKIESINLNALAFVSIYDL